MPFPISIVGVAVVGVVGTVGTIVGMYDDHSDYSDYSDYSDRAYREEQARKRREEERKKNLAASKREMDSALGRVKDALAGEIRAQGLDPAALNDWNPKAEHLHFSEFDTDYDKLDSQARAKINAIVDSQLGAEIQTMQQELDTINQLIRKVNETRLTGN